MCGRCLQVHQRRSRYKAGLQKQLAAETEVATMKAELVELQPKLIQNQMEVRLAAGCCCCWLAGCTDEMLPCSAWWLTRLVGDPRSCRPLYLRRLLWTLVVVNQDTEEAEEDVGAGVEEVPVSTDQHALHLTAAALRPASRWARN
jgi:hypothetical protein